MKLINLIIFLVCLLILGAQNLWAAEDIVIKADTMSHNQTDGTVNAKVIGRILINLLKKKR